jgi:D-glycero-D-manno-heptose 1,7-bisphosphate phosphatase
MSELEAVHARVLELLAPTGVEISSWNYCFHHPDGVVPELSGPCDCRKPQPGLLLRALAESDAEAGNAWMIGDADSDVAAGQSAGTRTALLTNPLSSHRRNGDVHPDVTVPDLQAFARLTAR